MIIASLDLAGRTGFCWGKAGDRPASGSWELRPPGGTMYDESGELAFQLGRVVAMHDRPDLIVVEEALEAASKWRQGYAASFSLKSQHMLQGALHAWAAVSRISVRRVAANTVRAHVCGRMSDGNRDKTKQMVLERVKALGLVPADCKDTDQADAVAIWAWAQDVIANVRGPLVLMS